MKVLIITNKDNALKKSADELIQINWDIVIAKDNKQIF